MNEETPDLARLLREVKQGDGLKRQAVGAAVLDPRIARLRAFQSERLGATHADLMADPRYRPACLFFLTDIYAPRDFSQRDHDIEQLHGGLSHLLPARTLRVLGETIELNRMTAALDEDLAAALFDRLRVGDVIAADQYAAAYRLCDNYEDRLRQIELTARILVQVGEDAHLRGVGFALKLARGPAERLGWLELYEFVMRGYAAFKQMRDVRHFAGVIRERETKILDRIFAGSPDPFAV